MCLFQLRFSCGQLITMTLRMRPASQTANVQRKKAGWDGSAAREPSTFLKLYTHNRFIESCQSSHPYLCNVLESDDLSWRPSWIVDDALSPALRWSIYSEAPESEAKPSSLPQTSQKGKVYFFLFAWKCMAFPRVFLLFERFRVGKGKRDRMCRKALDVLPGKTADGLRTVRGPWFSSIKGGSVRWNLQTKRSLNLKYHHSTEELLFWDIF